MDMKDRILEIAQRLIQERGVNGFSYADIAKELGIAKASLHHHFATKTDLVVRLLELYTNALADFLDAVERKPVSSLKKITAYCELYQQTMESDRVCMGGMLSAEAITLNESILPHLETFFLMQQSWLKKQLEAGLRNGELTFSNSAETEACTLIAALQGALIVSRSTKTTDFFDNTLTGLLTHLTP